MKRKQIDKVLYLKNDSLLTQSEQKFYFILAEIIQDRYLIFSKVRIPDIVHIPEWYKPYYWAIYWWDRIKSKHVDFLVCDRNSFEPLLVIEVDDPLHLLPKGKKRDGLVNFVFRKAGLPILHLTDESLKDAEALKTSIERNLEY